ncbi:hypothetical protein ACIP2X_09985 [Streptomyces sp. NPDC089424]|uniref:hypothetical protein n=1 Tax=Streptomyces sp. NPDC089424 TaxID=3365917 RepID=UPI003815B9AD
MDPHQEAVRGLNDIEHYLYRQAHMTAARRRVAAFLAYVPELTGEQKVRIERWYLEEQRYIARMVTGHITAALETAQERHDQRFGRWLRGTRTSMIVITLIMGLVVAVVLGSTR